MFKPSFDRANQQIIIGAIARNPSLKASGNNSNASM
jgi:hypothetical protein